MLSIPWDKKTLLDSFENQINETSATRHKALPCYVLWGLWLVMNKMIFRHDLSIGQVSYNIRLSYHECWKEPKQKAARILKKLVINSSFPSRFFDRVCQGSIDMSEARAIFFQTIVTNARLGTNNKEEVYALLVLMKIAEEKGSKSSICQITNLTLGPIMNRVLEVKNHFDFIFFTCIYRDC